MYKARLLIIIASLMCILVFPVNAWSAFKTKLTSTQIQNSMVQHFPIREYAAFARITLQLPDVNLSKGVKELVLIMPIDANIPGQDLRQGHAQIGVFIEYNPADGGLYLSDPRIIKFEMPSIDKDTYKEIVSTLDNLFKNSLPLIQIYKVEESDLNHSLSKSVLKYFTIDEGHMNIEFGFE